MTVATATLYEVADINPRFDRAEFSNLAEVVTFVPMAKVSEVSGAITTEEHRPVGELLKGFTPFSDRDVLVAKITPCFENGKIAHARISKRAGFSSTEFHVVRADTERLDDRYLFHFLRQPLIRVRGEKRMTGSGGQRRVPKAFLESLKVPLPPLAEQRRIAAILDNANALRAKRREAIAKLDQLLQCVFIDMFGDPVTNPKGLSELSLGELVSSTKIGLVRSANEFGEDFDIPYVRMDAVSADGKFLPDKVKKTSASESEMSDYALEPGDFLFNTRNSKELVGKTCVYNGPPGWTFNNNLMRIRFKEGVASSVIAMQFQFGRVKRELEKRKSGTTSVYAVYWRELQSLPLLLPPASQQQKFAAIKAKIEAHRRALQRHGTQFDDLFAGVRQRAFAGTL
ncbi:restriction endonuclease subunit S [Luteimonas sp. YGD11-2]|uniref:restriction endonuclease subunit S n=1 Tax=Luteimonas sp. YGD11-2 TaxID=2508168 RepID=UPI00100AE30D|nr:restriction endonuclease subunit S [Luteimonas sp. YGD11-2]